MDRVLTRLSLVDFPILQQNEIIDFKVLTVTDEKTSSLYVQYVY